MAIYFATPFATKNVREKIVEILSKIWLLQLKFDEISKKFWTKFRQFFVAKRFATTFCHNILPRKKSLKFRQRFRCFNSSSDKILTKKYCGKTFCHKAPDEKSDEILKRKKQRKSLYQKILQVVGNHGGVRSQYIYIYAVCCESSCLIYIYIDTSHCIKCTTRYIASSCIASHVMNDNNHITSHHLTSGQVTLRCVTLQVHCID